MTADQLERNLTATLGLAVIAGLEDPDRWGELGGNAVVLLGQLKAAGGLRELVLGCPETRAGRDGRA